MSEAQSEQFLREWIRAQPVVLSYLASLLPRPDRAEDLLQDVAVVLLRKYSTYDPARGTFVGWALGVAKREVQMTKRRHARSQLAYNTEVVELLCSVYEELSAELEPRARMLRECLSGIDVRTRDLLRMRYEDSLKPREIAQRLGQPVGRVRVRLSRLRASLFRCVDERVERHGSS